MMDAEVDKNTLRSSTFSTKVWLGFVDQIKVETGRIFSLAQVKCKHNRLRIKCTGFTKLINTTGFGWDSETQTVTAEEEVWETYIKANPNSHVFKTKGCLEYEALCKIFKQSTATGMVGRASTQGPLDSDEERKINSEFAQTEMCEEVNDVEISKGSCRRKSTSHSNSRPSKSPKTSFRKNCMEALTEASRARTEKLKLQTTPNPFSMTNCLAVLESMEDVLPNQYLKALDAFAKYEVYREAFVGMSEERRRTWLASLLG